MAKEKVPQKKIEMKDFQQLPTGYRNSFQKAQQAIKKNNPEYAIEIIKEIVKKHPGYQQGRDVLREQERIKTENLGAFSKLVSGLKIAIITTKARSSIGKKPMEAMKRAEDALALNLGSTQALILLADAGQKLEAPFIEIEALEMVIEFNPRDESALHRLADAYKRGRRGGDVLRIRQKIASLHPDDLKAQAALREASALATMSENQWEEEGSSMEKVKSKEETEALEQEERIVRNIDDVQDMIERTEPQFQENGESIEIPRKLAGLYQRAGRHQDAIKMYEVVVERMGTLDPAIDAGIEKSNVAMYDVKIEELRQSGGDEAEIQRLENEKYQYRLESAENRVEKYPNETELHYQLALVYWEGENIDKALERFQFAQKNPHRRLDSIVFLGRCFHAKSQYDLAIEQYEKAKAEMLIMDKLKMNCLYHEGITYEAMGQAAKAVECFKEIYQANVNYRDVGGRINAFYEQSNESPSEEG